MSREITTAEVREIVVASLDEAGSFLETNGKEWCDGYSTALKGVLAYIDEAGQ